MAPFTRAVSRTLFQGVVQRGQQQEQSLLKLQQQFRHGALQVRSMGSNAGKG
jgi:hypothetical protein